ncbi:hypothetical protein ABBQ32_011016 [Trebouxia sp. C0010 RCD-2024]
MFSTSKHRPLGRPRPGAQRHNSKIVIGVGLIVVIILLANSGFPSSHKSARAAERQLANRVLEVQDYGGTQEVAIQQGDTTTVIQQDPNTSRPRLEVIDNNGVHTASKYKPLDTPGISVTKGGTDNSNTLVHVGEGNAKQSIELLRNPRTATDNASNKAPLVTGTEAAAGTGSQGETSLQAAKSSVTTKTGTGSQASSASSKTRSSFLGGGTTEDSAASSNITERASQDQKQAMAATDRQTVGEVSSSSSDDAHPKDPARRPADNGLSGALSSVGMAAAAVASGVKVLASNQTKGGCTDETVAALPQLKLEQLWKPSRSGFDTDVTLVTQLSLESLSMLQNQCELWSGPIAAVAYMPLVKGKLVSMDDAALNGTTVEEQKTKLAAFYASVTHAGPCRMTLELVSEEVPSAYLSTLYPFNALRNHALLLVRTEVVLLLDVDFLPAEELSRIFSGRQEYQSTLVYLYNNAVIVLPAFETLQGAAEGQSLALQLAKGDKDSMMEAIVDRKVRQYQVSEYEKGQRATDYATWLSSSAHYTAKFEEGFEPYIISARKNVPWYDERFRGHGRDRIVQTLNMAGFVSFAVHPTTYVVQQPHPLSASTHFARGTPKFQELIQTYAQIRGSILAGEYEPVSAFSCQQGRTSYTAADLPTKGQVSEAAYAASQASAGRLAALTSQGAAQAPASAALDPAQQLQQAQRESAQQQQARTNSAAGIAPGNVTAISSKAVAAKAAAASAAEDLQDDTDETAAMSQSVDVAAQLQHAQQLAQQQAADFKQNHEGSNTRLDASSTSATAGASLGLSTGSSSAADPTALTADASTMDPAEKLQLAQQHQQQQAAAFKQNNEGTAVKLDTASNAAAAASGVTGKLDSATKDSGGSSSDTSKRESNVAAGGLTDASDELGSGEAIKLNSVDGVGQVAV